MEHESSTREVNILTINTIEILTANEEGVELNEGYTFDVNGSIPQLADGIAKMAIEMDKDIEMGERGGGAFIALIMQYYERLNSLEGGETHATV